MCFVKKQASLYPIVLIEYEAKKVLSSKKQNTY